MHGFGSIAFHSKEGNTVLLHKKSPHRSEGPSKTK
jgi:hypothetical protein